MKQPNRCMSQGMLPWTDKTYYYKIVAFDKSGSKITKSNASKAKKIFVK